MIYFVHKYSTTYYLWQWSLQIKCSCEISLLMKKVFASIGLVFAAALVAFPAHANIIYSEVEFFATNSSAVGYMEFEVTNAGTFTIDAFGFSTLGE